MRGIRNEHGHLLGEYLPGGSIIEETVWLGDTPVATLQPSASGITAFYIHSDHLNTPRIISATSGNAIVWRWDLDPFGSAAPNSNPSGLGVFNYALRFPGQFFDGETGRSNNYFRDYDPQVGRFLESDPAGLSAGVNTFGYVGQNPLSSSDQFGLDETLLFNSKGGRSWFKNGPTNGNWGGGCWSGGQYSCDGHPMGTAPPTDSADACYMKHDKCYDSCSTGDKACVKTCDHNLVNELMSLPDDPLKWLHPPRKGTEKDSSSYKYWAIKIFK